MKLLDELVQASGLSPLFAKSAIQRALDRARVGAERVSPEVVDPLVDDLRRVIAIFAPQEADGAADRIRVVLRRRS